MKSLLPRAGRFACASATLLGCAMTLSACSSDHNEWPALFEAARSYWTQSDTGVTLNQAGSIPYATLGVRLNGDQEHMMVLATDVDGDQLWVSPQLALKTHNGRIASTSGLVTDLATHFGRSGPIEDWRVRHSYAWLGDFPDLGVFSVQVTCSVVPEGPDPVEILGKQIATFRVDEACSAPALGWNFTNRYWISESTGLVWKSVQHPHPKGPEIALEILRPPLSYQ